VNQHEKTTAFEVPLISIVVLNYNGLPWLERCLGSLRKQTIYEICGIADIMRGDSDPRETLGAQKIKAQFGGLIAPGAYDLVDDAAMIPPVVGDRSRVITTGQP